MICTTCNNDLPKESFSKRKSNSKGLRKRNNKGIMSSCKECVRKYQKDAVLKYRYGITRDKYNEIFNNQEGKCLICNKHQNELNKTLSVDHNHYTNEIRGLLCDKCNTAIGLLQEDIEIFHNCISYLKCRNNCNIVSEVFSGSVKNAQNINC